MATVSSSSPERAGFRIERPLGADLWEATQPELGRRVALRRLPPDTSFDAERWPERPGVVALYAVVEAPDGIYVATRFVPGARTLAECAGARPAKRNRWLDEVAATLDGAVHGRLTEHDILIADGRALVTGFGRPPDSDDGEALARMRSTEHSRALWPTVAVGAAVLAVVVFTAVLGGADDARGPAAPPVPAGATAIGSTLEGMTTTVDCEGGALSAASLPCTIVPVALPGRRLTTLADGVVRGWAVRGAKGRLQLLVVRPTGEGFVVVGETAPVNADGQLTLAKTDLRVPADAQFALRLSAGAGVGIRRDNPGAATVRYFGTLDVPGERTDTRGGRGEELLLRVDVDEQ